MAPVTSVTFEWVWRMMPDWLSYDVMEGIRHAIVRLIGDSRAGIPHPSTVTRKNAR
jgi:hypothetical protein